MATRAVAAATARRSGLAAVLSSFRRRGGARGLSHSSTQRREEEEQSAAGRHAAAAATAAQVEASLNRKNVEVVRGDRSETLLADEAADALGGVGAAEAEDAWVPDQETGVFVPADEAAAANGSGGGAGGPHDEQLAGPPSVLDQAVFVREDMEDVERPAVDMAGDAK